MTPFRSRFFSLCLILSATSTHSLVQRPAFQTAAPPRRSSGSSNIIAFTRLHVSTAVTASDTIADGSSISSSASKGASTGVVDWDWKSVADSAFDTDKRPIILFDGQCNLCNGAVNFALDRDPNANFRFVSLTSIIGRSLLVKHGRKPSDLSSIVLCTPDTAYFESEAVLKISQDLEGLPFQVLGYGGFAIPPFLRDQIYHFVSENRWRFGTEGDQCRLDFDGEFDNRFLEDPILDDE
mmetsp:Transcript_4953/g.7513  ORF Transcript_4953/g.7513 Transcript_4953/m.7513 type:complete len:238 (+) Transcript_4953:83-796(+)|eukprot:CAMPEP_0195291424 /NCGR_PEP_ID=MMETSP0707-20130614/7789_1 /TAXON_ID=33640 /ORGANISM="Asterionellopsis glacialis, Strain CCMP134" /LENGTH=237 /DNA_ID=CAMNT_0040351735 /DNA_START=43 /DNA_END=756 /DNA_ORIENTATION=+